MSVEGSTTPSAAILAEGAQSQENQMQPQLNEAQPSQKPPQEDKFAAKFAALARKEKELRDSQGRFMSEKQKIEAEKAELEKWRAEQRSERENILAEIKNNPLKWLQENAGYDFESLTKMQLNEQNPTPEMLIQRTRAELESSYKKDLEELRKSLKEKEEQEERSKYEQTVAGFKSQIADYVAANAETYELTKMNEAEDLIFDVIQEFYDTNGRILSIEDAAKHVEEHFENEAKKVLEAKKFKQTSPKPVEQVGEKPAGKAPTLSNTLAAEVPTTGKKSLTKEESLAAAARMLRWHE